MNDLSLVPAPALAANGDRLKWGVVELQVTDLDRAVNFWTVALGLIERPNTAPGIALGTQETTLIILHPGASEAVQREFTGMYHVAIGVRTQAEFSRLLARLIHLQVQVAPTDHLMAKSLYLADPDGLEIEITFETPERFGHFGDMSKGLELFDTQGRPHSGRGPLDVEAELAFAKGLDLGAPIATDTYLAHLHFKVGALEPTLEWFETLGFERHLTLQNWGFADMGAGAENTHRLAMNIWSGPNRPPAPKSMAGLTHYELLTHDQAVLDNQGLERAGDTARGRDPMNIEFSIRATSFEG